MSNIWCANDYRIKPLVKYLSGECRHYKLFVLLGFLLETRLGKKCSGLNGLEKNRHKIGAWC